MSGRLFGVIETIGDGQLIGRLRDELVRSGVSGTAGVVGVKSSGNGAVDRNAILAQAGDADFVFLIDDTLIPRNIGFALSYEDLMDRFGYSVMFYGYAKGANKVLSVRPNPGILLKIGETEVLHVTQFPISSMTVVDRRRNKLAFDETLKHMYLDEFLHRSALNKLMPFNGFYLDIPQSWTMFDERRSNRTADQLKKELDEIKLEREVLAKKSVSVNTENNVNMFIQFVQAKLAETGGR